MPCFFVFFLSWGAMFFRVRCFFLSAVLFYFIFLDSDVRKKENWFPILTHGFAEDCRTGARSGHIKAKNQQPDKYNHIASIFGI